MRTDESDKKLGNFYKKYKILGGFHKIKDQMLVVYICTPEDGLVTRNIY